MRTKRSSLLSMSFVDLALTQQWSSINHRRWAKAQPTTAVAINNGFTLIELVITMAIIGILASIAYPSYLDYVTRARRHDGQTALLELANQMEQYYADNNTYQTATIATGNPTDIRSSNTSSEGWYSLAITEQSDTRYALQATAINAQAKNDKLCQNLIFNSVGEKGPIISSDEAANGAFSRCW